MAGVGSLAIILGGSLLLGWVYVRLFPIARRLHPLERLLAMVGLGVLIGGLLALGLAQFGMFSPGNLALLGLIAGAMGLGLSAGSRALGAGVERGENDSGAVDGPLAGADRRPLWGEWPADPRREQGKLLSVYGHLLGSDRLEYALLGVWLLLAGWLFLRPHEFVLGGADAGVYVNLAASINATGGILIQDPALAALDLALYPALLRGLPETEFSPYYLLPGFYVNGEPPGEITPQFYPLHPVWQAVAYGLGGVRAALLLTGLWALLSGLTVYVLVRRLLGWPVALLALAGLTINGLQVWFARYPTTEMLTQFLLWLGVWALGTWLLEENRPRALWGLLAGLALGQTMLVRIDMYFLLAVPVVVLGWSIWTGRLRWALTWFFVPLSLMAAYSLVHALLQSAPYFSNTFGYGVLLIRQYWIWPAALTAAGFAAFLFAFRNRNRLARLVDYRPGLLSAMALAIFLLAAYGWFIRPFTDNIIPAWQDWYGGSEIANFDHENLRRLGWYLTPFGVWVGVAGLLLLTRKLNRYTAAVVGVGLFYALLYLWRIQANPHQIYAMRRYIPVVVPLFIIGAAAFCGWLSWRRSRWYQAAAVFLAALWLGGLGLAARGLISQVDYGGLVDQLQGLDAQLAPGAVIIFDDPAPVGAGDIWGTPLRFIYGHTVFGLRDRAAADSAGLLQTIARWQEAGRTVYWVGPPEWLDNQGLLYASATYTVTTQVLESIYEARPTNRLPYGQDFLIHRIAEE